MINRRILLGYSINGDNLTLKNSPKHEFRKEVYQMFIKNFTKSRDCITNRGEFGIDKIKLCLRQELLNRNLLDSISWHYDSNKRTKLYYLRTNRNLIIEKVGRFYLFIINQEFFNHSLIPPRNFILLQVCYAIHCLATEKFIPVQPQLELYLPYIQHITELEIYFSLKKKYFDILQNRFFSSREEAEVNHGLFHFKETETFYSYNGYEDSSVCLYNKQKKDFHDNQYSQDEINSFRLPYRLEFRLRGKDVSDILKLHGSLNTVFTKFLPTLAFLHNKYVKNNLEFNIPIRSKYQRVIKKSPEVTSIRNRR